MFFSPIATELLRESGRQRHPRESGDPCLME
jgi:hypothetical protein